VRSLALRIAAVAKSKKAQDVIILDMRRVTNFCDYFVIASATSLRQANAIAQAIEEDLLEDKIKSLSRVGPSDQSGWIVVDFAGVIGHIFYKPMREFYALERLWADAKKVRIPAAKGKKGLDRHLDTSGWKIEIVKTGDTLKTGRKMQRKQSRAVSRTMEMLSPSTPTKYAML